MAILGSHNSMTYLPPKMWLMRLFSLFWRCQRSDLKRQYSSGVRCFDLRIRNIKEKWVFAHGLITLKDVELVEVLNYLSIKAITHNEIIYIRLILEELKPNIHQEQKFKSLCQDIEEKYKETLVFFEARRKFDWLQLYEFETIAPTVIQFVGSMKSFYGKICPWLYWKLNNKKDKEKISHFSDDTIVLYDFI